MILAYPVCKCQGALWESAVRGQPGCKAHEIPDSKGQVCG